jgi:hypothetical protein
MFAVGDLVEEWGSPPQLLVHNIVTTPLAHHVKHGVGLRLLAVGLEQHNIVILTVVMMRMGKLHGGLGVV